MKRAIFPPIESTFPSLDLHADHFLWCQIVCFTAKIVLRFMYLRWWGNCSECTIHAWRRFHGSQWRRSFQLCGRNQQWRGIKDQNRKFTGWDNSITHDTGTYNTRPVIPIIPDIPDNPEIPDIPEVPEEVLDEWVTEPVVRRNTLVDISDYLIPLAGMINMNEGDCFDWFSLKDR